MKKGLGIERVLERDELTRRARRARFAKWIKIGLVNESTRTQSSKIDKKFFYDILLEFRRAGHEVTWSTEPPAIILRFYDVPYAYSGYRKAAKALIERMKEWNGE